MISCTKCASVGFPNYILWGDEREREVKLRTKFKTSY